MNDLFSDGKHRWGVSMSFSLESRIRRFRLDEIGLVVIGIVACLLYLAIETIIHLNEEITIVLTIAVIFLFSVFTQYLINSINRSKQMVEVGARQYRMLADNMKDVVWTINNSLRVTYVSPSIKAIAGLEVLEVMNMALRDLVTPSTYPVIERALIDFFHVDDDRTSFQTSTLEYQLMSRQGEPLWMEAKLSVISDEKGLIQGVLCLSRDVTERRKANEELVKTQKMLLNQLERAQKLETIGTLTAGIAHDFNNILASVMSSSELVKEVVPEESPEAGDVQRVLKVCKRGKALVRRILSFTGKRGDKPRAFDMAEVVRECIQFLKATLPSSINLTSVIDPHVGYVFGDPIQVQQVLINLGTNAVHAMREIEAPELRISIHAWDGKGFEGHKLNRSKQRYMVLTVEDNGHGIQPEHLERIFDPFFTTKEEAEGTGLGLSIIHRIVESLKGAIEVKSEYGKCAIFRILFPRLEDQQAASGEFNLEETSGGFGEVILFADDDRDVIESVGKSLTRLGYTIISASDGKKAFELFQANLQTIDLVLVDQEMPYMTGTELSQAIYKLRPELPVIIFTGAIDDMERMFENMPNVRQILYKPIERGQLARILRQNLRVGGK